MAADRLTASPKAWGRNALIRPWPGPGVGRRLTLSGGLSGPIADRGWGTGPLMAATPAGPALLGLDHGFFLALGGFHRESTPGAGPWSRAQILSEVACIDGPERAP